MSTEGKTVPTYDPTGSVGEARQAYFDRYGFDTRGYTENWVALNPILGIPIGFPNTTARKAAVPIHDVHHVLTGYGADWVGEAEIGAWEVGGGCGTNSAAWILNLGTVTYGSVFAPKRTFQAFLRGRRARNLYPKPFDPAYLERNLGEMRAELKIDRSTTALRGTAIDYVLFAAAIGATFLIYGTPVVLLGLAVSYVV